jgi:transcription initiation factor TFIIIB Brf1 subunit/transcription initiation factor TFIIB
MITDDEAGEVICSKCGIVAARSIEYTKKSGIQQMMNT